MDYEKSYFPDMLTLWNSLSKSIGDRDSLFSFKQAVNKHLEEPDTLSPIFIVSSLVSCIYIILGTLIFYPVHSMGCIDDYSFFCIPCTIQNLEKYQSLC